MEKFILKRENDVQIAAYSWDLKEPKACVIIIHGIGEHALRYKRVAKKFNDNNIAVFSMDLRGHGHSYGSRGHCAPRANVLGDIDELINDVNIKHPNCPIILYGHSMGGNITLDYRNRGNKNGDVAGYIISAPWVKIVRQIPKYQYYLVKGMSKILPKLKIDTAIDSSVLGNKENMKDYDKDKLKQHCISTLCAVDGYDIGDALYDDTHEQKGDGRNKPMLLMHGDADRVCMVEGSRKIYENQKETCEYVEWPGLYHEIHNGGEISNGDEVIQKAIDWVNNLINL